MLVLLFTLYVVFLPFIWATCEGELQGILAEPESLAKEFLLNVDAQLRAQSALLFTPQRDSFLRGFESSHAVQVVVEEPFATADACNSCTGSLNTTETSGNLNFDCEITDRGLVKSIELNNFRAIMATGGGNLNLTLKSPSQQTQLIYNNFCPGLKTIRTSFRDGGQQLNVPLDCVFVALLKSPTAPTQPFSTFYGQSAQGTWQFAVQYALEFPDAAYFNLTSYSLDICYGPEFTRSLSRADFNVPAFTRNEGTSEFKLTSVYRDCTGQMLYVSLITDSALFKK